MLSFNKKQKSRNYSQNPNRARVCISMRANLKNKKQEEAPIDVGVYLLPRKISLISYGYDFS